jgi:hypothetical protein
MIYVSNTELNTRSENAKLCELCNRVFNPKKKIVRFCSRHCCNKWVNSLKENKVKIICANSICAKIFLRKRYLVKKVNFCSRTCYDDSRAKNVVLACYTCGRKIFRLPKEIHERNFCTTTCQANAPKYRGKCATCDIEITRRLTQTFENKTGNFYCSRLCYYKAMKKTGTHKARLQRNYYNLRVSALRKINSNLKCCSCGCKIMEILEINHINGEGRAEMKYRYKHRNIHFLKDIVLGVRKIDDLEIRCKICNILHYVETVQGIRGFTVKYEDVGQVLCIQSQNLPYK